MSTSAPPMDRTKYPDSRERVITQLIHWGVVIIVVVSVTILALLGHLDRSSTTALFGTVLGHAGTAASQKLQSRSSSDGASA